jgi:hypothetical protein
MNKLVAVALLSMCAYAADTEQRLVELKNISMTDRSQLAGFVGAFGVNLNFSPNDRFVVLRGTKEQLDAAEAAIKRIDKPPADIDVEFQIVAASAGGQDKVPQDLESVVKQLRKTFVYQNYRLVDSMQVRTREGKEASASSVVQSAEANSQVSYYNLHFSPALSGDEKGKVVRLDNLRFTAKIPIAAAPPGTGFSYTETGIYQNVDVRDGQKVVVGRANLNGKEGAFFLIVTAKVVD